MTRQSTGAGDISRSLELLWRGVGDHEPGTGSRPGPKPRLSLDQIVTTAIEVADQGGIDALSMRNVASELNLGVMGLYRYVPSKAELLDLMIDHLSGPAEELSAHRGENWRAAMEYTAHSMWDTYTAHPWLLQVGKSRAVLGPNTLAGLDFALGAFDGIDLTDKEKVAIFSAVEHHVTGAAHAHILQEHTAQEPELSEHDFWNAQLPFLERALSTGMFPHFAQLEDEDAFAVDGKESMMFGLQALLDGFEHRVKARKAT